MTSSSDRRTPRDGYPNVPAPEGSRSASSYTRFIPREELGDVQAWVPGSFGAHRASSAQDDRKPTGPSEQEWLSRVEAARQQGYADGHRDGLSELEAFKKSYTTQMASRVGHLVASFDAQWAELEAGMADAMARSALLLARQVLRSELRSHPAQVSAVAREALETVLMSARQIVVRVHPDDLALVADGAGEALQSRGARLQADASIQRGGCLVVSDAGTIDATIDARWARAADAIGQAVPWAADEASSAPLRPDESGASEVA